MNIARSAAVAALAAAIGALPAAAQVLAEGLQSSVQPLPGNVGAALAVAQGLVTFDGQDLVLTPPAQPPQLLLHLGSPVFTSFVADAGGNRVLLAESSTNAVWLVPLAGPAPAGPLATLPFAYDAVMLAPQQALVSAKVGGFASPDNDLVLLDLATGQTRTLARLPGASGPLERDANGDLYYATASSSFPTPPGTCSVLRLRANVVAAAIASPPTVLGVQHTELVFAGLDVASDLAFDDDGDLHFVDWLNARVAELNDVAGSNVTLGAVTVDHAPAPFGAVTVQFRPASGGAVFEPFQPAGGTLLVFESDFFATARLRSVRAAQAALAASAPSPIPAGPAAMVATNGPRLGIGVLAFDTVAAGATTTLVVPGFEQPLAWSTVLLGAPVTIVLPFDAAGAASLGFTNPGFATPLSATAQLLFVSTNGVLGATNPLSATFTQ